MEAVYHAMGHCDGSLETKGFRGGTGPEFCDFDEVTSVLVVTSKSLKDFGMSRRGEKCLPT